MARALTDLAWPRRTERLLLGPPRFADVPALHAYRSDPEVARWLSGLPATAEVLATQVLAGSTLVVEREGTVIGDLMLAVRDGWAQHEVAEQARGVQAELGWCFSPAHRGQGYAVEAVTALISLAFELGVRRIEANCFAENVASRRVMERVGLRQEGHYLAESLHRDGTWRDGMSYALLAHEWPPAGEQEPSAG